MEKSKWPGGLGKSHRGIGSHISKAMEDMYFWIGSGMRHFIENLISNIKIYHNAGFGVV